MDLMNAAQLLGNLGEFVGAIAVVITLAYLAVQVRHSRDATDINTKAIRASNYAAWNAAASDYGLFVAQHSEALAALEGKTKLSQLTSEERFVFSGFGIMIINQGQAAFLHHLEGSLPDEVFDAHMNGVTQMFEAQPMLRDAWQIYGNNYAASFREYIEGRVTGLKPKAA